MKFLRVPLRVPMMAATCLTLLLSLTACLEGSSDRPATPEQKAAARDAAGAEALTDSAEALITPISFPEAFDLVSRAVAKDPSNLRAQLYKKLLAIPMSQKGLLGRLDDSLINQGSADFRQKYDQAVQNARTLPANVRDFLLSGSKDIKTEGDVQDMVVRLVAALAEFREFVVAHKDDPFTITYYQYAGIGRAKCRLVRYSAETPPELVDCDLTMKTATKLERPDLENLAIQVGAYQVLASFTTAFDATGSIQLSQQSTKQKWTPKQIQDYIDQSPTLYHPRKNNRWSDFLAVGADAVQTLRYARVMHDEFCSPDSTPGKHRGFSQSFCLPERLPDGRSVDGLIDAFNLSLMGTSIDFEYENKFGAREITSLNLRDGFREPNSSALRFTQVDECGQLYGFQDPTLGGFLSRGDANDIFDTNVHRACPH